MSVSQKNMTLMHHKLEKKKILYPTVKILHLWYVRKKKKKTKKLTKANIFQFI